MSTARFIERFTATAKARGAWPPRTEHDPEWPLACACEPPRPDGTIAWMPTPRSAAPDLPPHLAEHFGALWSRDIAALWNGELVYVCFFENAEREARAVSSETLMLAHFPDDRWIAVDRETGAVTLEDPARPSQPIAASIAEWLDTLEPLAVW